MACYLRNRPVSTSFEVEDIIITDKITKTNLSIPKKIGNDTSRKDQVTKVLIPKLTILITQHLEVLLHSKKNSYCIHIYSYKRKTLPSICTTSQFKDIIILRGFKCF